MLFRSSGCERISNRNCHVNSKCNSYSSSNPNSERSTDGSAKCNHSEEIFKGKIGDEEIQYYKDEFWLCLFC